MASQTSQRKSHVFRVTGLSRDMPDEDLRASLQKTLNENFTDEERSQIKTEITIVPSCYDPDRERVALVQFRGGVPQFLSELTLNRLGDWQVETEDSDISIDCHFFGFTQLYTPDGKEPVIADIVAIAGLDGHAYGSWQGRGNLGRMWLRDFLSKDLPQCRTMIYGYNSKLSSHGVDTILDYGRELMEEIKKIRNTKELQQRPLFFIAHSFGGIILAHCLVRAIQTMDEDHPAITSLHRATYCMIFFAIPHKGLVVDDIQQMLAGDGKHPREKLLQQISSQSDLLVHQLGDFKNLIRDRKVVSFYETEQTRRLVLDTGSGRWKRTGDFITTVDADSALLQLPDHMEDKVPLHADHSMMVKFDTRNAAGYQTVLSKLQQFAKDAPPVVAARFEKVPHGPHPCSTVPFKKDPLFVGREEIIGMVKKKHGVIGQSHERVALIGLAGVGKTQTAIEYAYRVREPAADMWVFWIHASNATRLAESYQRIATVAEIPGRDDPKMNVLQLVYQWLCDARYGRWLMVLDNADDDKIFFHSGDAENKAALLTFLPQAAHGSILITSRNGLAARNLVGADGLVIDVQPMNEEESLALLRERIHGSASLVEDEKALVQALEYIPLAISQAGSYIANRSPRITASRYLELFNESESNQAHLLQQEDAKDLRRDPSIRYAVITTWQLSFEQIRQDQPSATDLLSLMSMYDRQGIPEELICVNKNHMLQFEDALAPLIDYSLIREEINIRLFSMHRLVQLSVRTWLEVHHELKRWQRQSLAIVAHKFPNEEYENWNRCQMLLPHAKELIKLINDDTEDEERLNMAMILSKCGSYLVVQGSYGEAEAMRRQALKAVNIICGAEHLYTLINVSNLGDVLSAQGKYSEAEAMHRRALEGYKKVLEPEHPYQLINFSNLGNVLSSQGKHREAEAMHRRALKGYERVLGPEHSYTLTSVNNLGNVLSSQGKYRQAEAMYQRALETRKKVLKPEHPDTLTSVSNLGHVLSSQGKYEEAEAMFRRALEGREKVLGPEHPSTLTTVNNIGDVLSSQEKFQEAEAMHRRALEAQEKVLGPEHPSTLTSINNLGDVLSSQRKYKEAEVMHKRALKTRKRVLGTEHPSTLTSVNSLGLVLSNQGKYDEAEAMHRRALEGYEKVLGLEHPDTLTSVSNLGLVLSSQGKYDEAEAMHRRALEGYKKVLEPEHPYNLINFSNLGNVLSSQGLYKEAEAMHRQALEGYEKAFGSRHPNTLTSINNLGSVLSSQGRYEEAEAMHRQVHEARENALGPQHFDTLATVNISDFLKHGKRG